MLSYNDQKKICFVLLDWNEKNDHLDQNDKNSLEGQNDQNGHTAYVLYL